MSNQSAADAFVAAFVTVFKFSSTLSPAVCHSCPHVPADHIYIAEFTSSVLPGGVIGVIPTHGKVICHDDCNCAGTWNLSVLSSVDTILV